MYDCEDSFYTGRQGYWSEYPLLQSCLLQATRLKSLRLSTAKHSHRHVTWRELHRNLGFASGDTYPVLESISMGGSRRDFRSKFCDNWLRGIELSKLQHLDFGSHFSLSLMEYLTGKLPRLRAIMCKRNATVPMVQLHLRECHSTVQDFLKSLTALKEFTFSEFEDILKKDYRESLTAQKLTEAAHNT